MFSISTHLKILLLVPVFTFSIVSYSEKLVFPPSFTILKPEWQIRDQKRDPQKIPDSSGELKSRQLTITNEVDLDTLEIKLKYSYIEINKKSNQITRWVDAASLKAVLGGFGLLIDTDIDYDIDSDTFKSIPAFSHVTYKGGFGEYIHIPMYKASAESPSESPFRLTVYYSPARFSSLGFMADRVDYNFSNTDKTKKNSISHISAFHRAHTEIGVSSVKSLVTSEANEDHTLFTPWSQTADSDQDFCLPIFGKGYAPVVVLRPEDLHYNRLYELDQKVIVVLKSDYEALLEEIPFFSIPVGMLQTQLKELNIKSVHNEKELITHIYQRYQAGTIKVSKASISSMSQTSNDKRDILNELIEDKLSKKESPKQNPKQNPLTLDLGLRKTLSVSCSDRIIYSLHKHR